MNPTDEVIYRESLLKKVHLGEKLSSSEKLWLVTNPLYHGKYGPPILSADVIRLPPNSTHSICIQLISKDHSNRIIPIVGSPDKMGNLLIEGNLRDHKGNLHTGKPVKMIGFEMLSLQNPIAELEFTSKSGTVSIAYECDFFDEGSKLMLRKSSTTGDYRLSMKKEMIADNKIIYRCSSPCCADYSGMCFTIEWKVPRTI